MPSIQTSRYQAKCPDPTGYIGYTDQENAVWSELFARQKRVIQNRVCDEYLAGLARLELPEHRIPQCQEVSRVLRDYTDWEVVPVPALIDFRTFFGLLAERKFPAASFIRYREDLEYVKEPDIFHEIFGHTPLLTDRRFAAFAQAIGRAGANAPPEYHATLARLHWFTVEFGLINTNGGVRSYGAGINSSIGETRYAVESDVPVRNVFDAIEVSRTPYRMDVYQRVYYVIDDFEQLYELAQMDLLVLIEKARKLPLLAPMFSAKQSTPAAQC